MNAERFKTFADAYTRNLRQAVNDDPASYMLKPGEDADTYAARVAQKLLLSVEHSGMGTVNKDGEGFKRTCKELNIKHTYKAINAYLDGE